MSGPNSPEIVQAYADIDGKLHRTRDEALVANKSILRQQAYRQLERIVDLHYADARTHVVNRILTNKDAINRWVDQYKENER